MEEENSISFDWYSLCLKIWPPHPMVIRTFSGHAFLSDGCLLWTRLRRRITSDWNRNWTPSLTDQWYLPDKWQRTWSRNGIWNNHTGLAILLACSSVYSKVEDNKAENKTHVDIKYEWEKMAAASISASSNHGFQGLGPEPNKDLIRTCKD